MATCAELQPITANVAPVSERADMPGLQCGTVAREMLQEAQAGRPQQTPSSVGSPPVDEAAPAIPTQTGTPPHALLSL